MLDMQIYYDQLYGNGWLRKENSGRDVFYNNDTFVKELACGLTVTITKTLQNIINIKFIWKRTEDKSFHYDDLTPQFIPTLSEYLDNLNDVHNPYDLSKFYADDETNLIFNQCMTFINKESKYPTVGDYILTALFNEYILASELCDVKLKAFAEINTESETITLRNDKGYARLIFGNPLEVYGELYTPPKQLERDVLKTYSFETEDDEYNAFIDKIMERLS